jgi:hypothetical protein
MALTISAGQRFHCPIFLVQLLQQPNAFMSTPMRRTRSPCCARAAEQRDERASS